MKNFVFYIETSNLLNNDDFRNLRKLYLPIVGTNAIVIYEYFNDIVEEKNKGLLNIEEICNQLQIDNIIFHDSLNKLEAVGLVHTFMKNDNNSFIFSIIKPNNIEDFNKNPLLKSHLIKLIGQTKFEKIYFEQKEKFINKNNYKNISKKYQEVFSTDFEENLTKIDDSYSTIDLVIDTFETHDENISKLPSSHFIKYLMKRNASWYENQLINSMLKMGFHDSTINLFLDFSFRASDLINCPYLSKIAQDFRERKIIHFNDVKHELLQIEEFKKRKYSKRNNNFKNNFLEKQNEITTMTEELSIEDIFSDDDIKEMF